MTPMVYLNKIYIKAGKRINIPLKMDLSRNFDAGSLNLRFQPKSSLS